ncbi:voltage-dependent calcium channel gamma-5 subunit-like [Homalodisca vitripennis]|uniref:voltage-dependent calcium channel gamma-5 subunit-like n=1 Tax=Homalodisca vitripennis TaxID=197043 RepID=UPI001EEA6ADA|nr:voltage-dependent calcium channel gamma-5 subunit-like [Homalodisca vitripennis]
MCSSGCLGVSAGFLSLITLISAVISGSWLYTRESVRLPGSQSVTAVTFRIGLWRVCPALKRIVTSPGTLLPAPGCQLIQYSSWPEVKETDLGISWSSLEFTPSFVTKMRYAMPLVALALALLMLATLFALLGHCHADLKTLVACGLYTIGGLMLASGLIVFVSVLSDVTTGPKKLEYRYGWSFHAAGTAFILSEIAALVSISAYLGRFSSVEDMVRAMVPGADRKLRHRQLCDDYLGRTEQGVENSLPTPPDVCTAKPQLGPISGRKSLKGVPITNMYDGIAKPPLHKRPQDPLMPQSHPATLVLPEHERYRYTTIIHQGLLGVAEGSSSSGSSATSGGSCSHSPPRSRLPALSPSRGRLPVHSPHCPRSSSPSSVSLGYCSAVT